MPQYMLDKKMLPGAGPDAAAKLYTTYLASSFRTLRFGTNEAHGRGMAVQFNYLLNRGAFVANSDGTFTVDQAKIPGAIRDLARDLLTMEALGDYSGAKDMLRTLVKIPAPLRAALDKLKDLPTDIYPDYK